MKKLIKTIKVPLVTNGKPTKEQDDYVYETLGRIAELYSTLFASCGNSNYFKCFKHEVGSWGTVDCLDFLTFYSVRIYEVTNEKTN